ncbi:MAG: hypothetical protein ACI936_003650 [Paraglaciecola sp.]|jgi:uncharacterized protein (TIGR00369 family)
MIIFFLILPWRELKPILNARVGGVYRGFAATLMDSATGFAVHTALEAGVGYRTVDLNVKMLKAVPKNVRLIAKDKVVHVSKSIGAAEGTLKEVNGTLYALATATCMIISNNTNNTN